jgi:large subunit ribosomal protein L10
MPNVVKKLVTAQYEDTFQQADGLILVSMAGLTVAETESLRTALDQNGAGLRMVKNSLARRVLADKGYEFGDEVLAGNVAIAYGSAEAAITAAKVFSKSDLGKAGKVSLRAGVLDGSALSPADAEALADVPDKDTLRAQLVGVIQAPLRGLAASLAALPGGLARVVQARVDAGGGAPESGAESSEEATAGGAEAEG